MSNKTQTMMVQVIAFFTAAISVIFLRQFYQGKSAQRISQPNDIQLTSQPKIFLECSEVLLSEDIVVTPIE